MRKVSVLAASVLLLGAGCAGGATVDANDIDTDVFTLRVPDVVTTEGESGGWRLQNFEGSDDPRAEYPEDAFFIEIREDVSYDDFVASYEEVEKTELAGEEVWMGLNGTLGGETWPHDAYYHEPSGTLIVTYYEDVGGVIAAEIVVQAIEWK